MWSFVASFYHRESEFLLDSLASKFDKFVKIVQSSQAVNFFLSATCHW